MLRRLPGHAGVALDMAKLAARAAARAHPRAGSAMCDVWRALPLADECADLVLAVFAPRNGPQVSPRPATLRPAACGGRLAESTWLSLVSTLGLIEVDAEKETRLDRALSRFFPLETVRPYQRELLLSHTHVALLVAMGPSARHVEPAQVSACLASQPEPAGVTAAVELRVYRPVRSTDRPLPSHTAQPAWTAQHHGPLQGPPTLANGIRIDEAGQPDAPTLRLEVGPVETGTGPARSPPLAAGCAAGLVRRRHSAKVSFDGRRVGPVPRGRRARARSGRGEARGPPAMPARTEPPDAARRSGCRPRPRPRSSTPA